MFPCYGVTIMPGYVEQFCERLASLRILEKPIRAVHHDAGYTLFEFDYRNYCGPENAQIDTGVVSFAELGIRRVEDEEGAYLSGEHQPEGILLIYDQLHPEGGCEGRVQVSVLDIAPTVLRHFGVPLPAYMTPPAVKLLCD